jgi:hypothetical protein
MFKLNWPDMTIIPAEPDPVICRGRSIFEVVFPRGRGRIYSGPTWARRLKQLRRQLVNATGVDTIALVPSTDGSVGDGWGDIRVYFHKHGNGDPYVYTPVGWLHREAATRAMATVASTLHSQRLCFDIDIRAWHVVFGSIDESQAPPVFTAQYVHSVSLAHNTAPKEN